MAPQRRVAGRERGSFRGHWPRAGAGALSREVASCVNMSSRQRASRREAVSRVSWLLLLPLRPKATARAGVSK